MLIAIVFGFLVFVLVTLGVVLLPAQSAPGVALDSTGHTLIEVGRQAAELIQLPLTVPIFAIGRHGSLANVQQAAMQDRTLWALALIFWAMLALLMRRGETQAIAR